MTVEARPVITQWQPSPSPGPYYTGDPLPPIPQNTW